MKPRAWPLLIVLLACATPRPEGLAPSIGGSLAIDVYPNPIIAKQVRADLYQLPFEVSLRETGGMDVEIDGIRIEVRLAALRIFAQAFDETELTRRGYSATVPAGSNVQYKFSPQRELPADLPLPQLSALVVVSGLDTTGRRTEARTTVLIRR